MKDIQDAIAKRRKVALYARMDSSNWYTVWEVGYTTRDEHYQLLPDGELRENPRQDYVRITEPVEVEFAPINNDVIVQNAVAALDEKVRQIYVDCEQTVAEIRQQKAQLLALAHQTEAA